MVLTTYGTLRRDVDTLSRFRFDYCILDESQAIKNADSATAKAARLLRADHRLSMTGTPIENRVEELLSQVQFLNPGLLGRNPGGGRLAGLCRNGRADALLALRKGVRPFLLRRTKKQVAPDLPPKTEQVIYCELEGRQRQLYTELRDYYRAAFTGDGTCPGSAGRAVEVLSALTRLRQAACHPALVNGAHADAGAAKLDVLAARLDELRDSGHKALVFSQFTTFLGIVKQRLEAAGHCCAYLDGGTRNREAEVERFQHDAAVGIFLISLKAGGVGLNLTAAEHVFLLDPWWNPAAETQAVDRAYRIGQTAHVFAYRLIARDTVEEKVVALQQEKRALAKAVLADDLGGVPGALTRDDLTFLLG